MIKVFMKKKDGTMEEGTFHSADIAQQYATAVGATVYRAKRMNTPAKKRKEF